MAVWPSREEGEMLSSRACRKIVTLRSPAEISREKQTTSSLPLSQLSLLFISGVSLKQDNADVFVVDLSFVPRKKELKKGIFGKSKIKHKEIINAICQ